MPLHDKYSKLSIDNYKTHMLSMLHIFAIYIYIIIDDQEWKVNNEKTKIIIEQFLTHVFAWFLFLSVPPNKTNNRHFPTKFMSSLLNMI